MKTFKKFRIELEESMLGTLGKIGKASKSIGISAGVGIAGSLALDKVLPDKEEKPKTQADDIFNLGASFSLPAQVGLRLGQFVRRDVIPALHDMTFIDNIAKKFEKPQTGKNGQNVVIPGKPDDLPVTIDDILNRSKGNETKQDTQTTIVANNPARTSSNTASVPAVNEPIKSPSVPEQPKPITLPQIPTNQQTPNKIKMSSIKGYESKKGYFVPQHWKQDETSGKWKSTVKGSTTQLSDAEYKKLSAISPPKLK